MLHMLLMHILFAVQGCPVGFFAVHVGAGIHVIGNIEFGIFRDDFARRIAYRRFSFQA